MAMPQTGYPGYAQPWAAAHPQHFAAAGCAGPFAAGFAQCPPPGYAGHAGPCGCPSWVAPPGTACQTQRPCNEDRERGRSREGRDARGHSARRASPERREPRRQWVGRPVDEAPPGHVWVRGRQRRVGRGEHHDTEDVWGAVPADYVAREVDRQRREERAKANAVAAPRREQAHSPTAPARERQDAAESPRGSPARGSKGGREPPDDGAANEADEAAHAAAAQRKLYKRAKKIARRAIARMAAAQQGLRNEAGHRAGAEGGGGGTAGKVQEGTGEKERAGLEGEERAAQDAAQGDPAGTTLGRAGRVAGSDGSGRGSRRGRRGRGGATVTGLTVDREAKGTLVTVFPRGRQVVRPPGCSSPSEGGSSDAALPVGGEPEQADGLYDDLDEPAPAADGLPNDLGVMFDGEPDDSATGGVYDDEPDGFAAEREAAAVGKEGAADAGNKARQRGRTDARERQFRMPAPPGPDGFSPSFFSAAKPLVSRAAAAAERAAGPALGLRSRAGRSATKTPAPHGSGAEGPASEDEGPPRRRGPATERRPVGTDLEDLANRERMLSGQVYRIPLKPTRPLALSAEGDQRVAVIASIQRIRRDVMERGEYGCRNGALGYGPVPLLKQEVAQHGNYVPCPLSDAHGATMGLPDRERRRFNAPGAENPVDIMQSGRTVASATDEAPYWHALGFAEVKQAMDEEFYLRVCSPKPDWDDDVVDTLAGSTEVSKGNRGGVHALGAVARRDSTAGKYLGEQTKEQVAAQHREAERGLHANRRGGGKGKGKGHADNGKGKGKGKGRGGRQS